MWKLKRKKRAPDDEPVVGVDAPEFTEAEVKQLRERARLLQGQNHPARATTEQRDGAA